MRRLHPALLLATAVIAVGLVVLGVLVWPRASQPPGPDARPTPSVSPPAGPPPSGSLSFGLATWNLLHDALARDIATPQQRTDLVAATVRQRRWSVLGSQEVSGVQRTRLLRALPGWRASDSVNRVVFWDNARFRLVDQGRFRVAKSVGTELATWVRLRARADRHEFVVMTVHAEPYRKRRLHPVDVRQIVREALRLVGDTRMAYFLTGDMNSDYRSSRELIYRGLTASGRFRLAHDVARTRTGDRCATFTNQRRQRCGGAPRQIDHVYVSPGVSVRSWTNLATPDMVRASDHNPVGVQVTLR